MTSFPLAETNNCNDVKCPTGDVVILNRKEVGNPIDYFNKNFAEYEAGFEAKGELWLGLKKLHQLTAGGDYSLRVDMTDFDGKSYVAYYDQFKVGAGEDYTLTVTGFDSGRSTLGDAMSYHSGRRFSAKDKDQDIWGSHCASQMEGGGWFYNCANVHFAGRHTSSRQILNSNA